MQESQETSFLHAREVSQDSHIIQELLSRGGTMSLETLHARDELCESLVRHHSEMNHVKV